MLALILAVIFAYLLLCNKCLAKFANRLLYIRSIVLQFLQPPTSAGNFGTLELLLLLALYLCCLFLSHFPISVLKKSFSSFVTSQGSRDNLVTSTGSRAGVKAAFPE